MSAPAHAPPVSPPKVSLKGAWLVGVAVGLSAVAMAASLAIQQRVQLVTHRHPGTGAWYFVQQDFIAGCCQAAAMVISLSLALAFRRRYPTTAMIAAIVQIFNVGPALLAAVIWVRTTHLFSSDCDSTSPWPTAGDYFALKGYTLVPVVVLAAGALVARVVIQRKKRGAAKAG